MLKSFIGIFIFYLSISLACASESKSFANSKSLVQNNLSERAIWSVGPRLIHITRVGFNEGILYDAASTTLKSAINIDEILNQESGIQGGYSGGASHSGLSLGAQLNTDENKRFGRANIMKLNYHQFDKVNQSLLTLGVQRKHFITIHLGSVVLMPHLTYGLSYINLSVGRAGISGVEYLVGAGLDFKLTDKLYLLSEYTRNESSLLGGKFDTGVVMPDTILYSQFLVSIGAKF